jgi:hypothetical protein
VEIGAAQSADEIGDVVARVEQLVNELEAMVSRLCDALREQLDLFADYRD